MATDDLDEDVGDAVEDVDTDVEEASSSPSTFKEKMSVLKSKSKEFGSAAGAKAKELAVQVSDATVEAAEVASAKTAIFAKKAGRATKEAAVATGSKSKELAGKAAEATKEIAGKTAEATKEAADKTSLAVSAGIAVAKENLDDAKERRKAAKEATTVVVDPNEIVLGPDIESVLDESNTPMFTKETSDNTPEVVEKHAPIETKQYVIVPNDESTFTQDVMSTNQKILRTTKDLGRSVIRDGPDFMIGWLLLAVCLTTLANIIASITELGPDVVQFSIGLPHFMVATATEHVWIQAITGALMFMLLSDAILLSVSSASPRSYRRLSIVFTIAWVLPGINQGGNFASPFENEGLREVLWHLVAIPMLILITMIRSEVLRQRQDGERMELSDGHDWNGGGRDSPLVSNTAPDLLESEWMAMGLNDELNEKPRRRERMEFYEWIFFFFMWLFIFGSIAMGVKAGTENEGASSVMASSYMPAIGLCMSLAVILAFILFRMDRSARSSIDMAKRRERYNAMQDEYWETRRVEFRLKRESMEQGGQNAAGVPSDA
jgi:hypothetical protein